MTAPAVDGPATRFLADTTRFLFFTGKGGVGKTALACASAMALSDAGKRVLLVSTDPASNLDEMLGVALSNRPLPVPGVKGLQALNIDPEAAAEAYRQRAITPYLTTWTTAQVDELREQLSGSCTTEIAAFDEFAALLAGDSDKGGDFEHIVFDTAPTGHTLRLLSLPRAWTEFLATNTRGASCLGPHSGLNMHQGRFSAALAALCDAGQTTVMLVTRPEPSALKEAARTSEELQTLGLRNQRLIVNGVFTASRRDDRVARALEQRGRDALATLPPALGALARDEVPLRGFNMVGLPALRALLLGPQGDSSLAVLAVGSPPTLPRLLGLVDELAAAGHGLIMVMGKGGVGKTTIAAAIANELAARGLPVHLSTTDPAAHVAATLQDPSANLVVTRIDPARETQAYRDRIMAARGKDLDDEGRALLAEDLRSPCNEEVAVFGAFSQLVGEAREKFVVLDTAPTGHTLLLLDATGAYHRQIVKSYQGHHSGRIVTPLMRLRDPDHTKILLVTLAETTPVSEAADLQADLRRAQIEPYAWVINSSLAAAGSEDPLLRQRIAEELKQIQLVQTQHAKRVAIVAWQAEPPVGPARLQALLR
ncbi:MAG TPA: arsenical pump-driving ATPase [Polyangia bacterium]